MTCRVNFESRRHVPGIELEGVRNTTFLGLEIGLVPLSDDTIREASFFPVEGLCDADQYSDREHQECGEREETTNPDHVSARS